MNKKLKEEITLKQTKVGNYDVYYIKPETKEEGDIIYQNKDLLSRHGAKWNGPNKIWFWFIDKDNPQKTIDRIKVALDELNKAVSAAKTSTTTDTPAEGGGSPEAEKLLVDIDKVIAAINVEDPAKREDFNMTKEEEDKIKGRLQAFKEMLVNIEDDEQFKETMKNIIDFKAAQGYEFSLLNALLIMLQNRNATIVNSKSNWKEKYNRTVNANAKSLVVWAPSGQKFSAPKDKIAAAKAEFYKKIGKKQGDSLTPREKFDLDKITKAKINAVAFKLVPVYDAADTTQIEGTEDYIKKAQEAKKDIPWFEENMISDEVRPIYKGLLDFAQDNEIKVEFLDDLQGARGVSASGAIKLLKNEGNDVGLTKTLAHEITHELLHQKYLSQKGKESSKFYIGQPSRETVEQQAELSAWMFMYSFGFDLKTTSLNYTIMWGGNKENMVQVFDTVSKVVNFLIDYVNRKIKQPMDEEQGSFSHGKHISPHDIAQLLGVEKTYDKLTQGELHERLRMKLNLIKENETAYPNEITVKLTDKFKRSTENFISTLGSSITLYANATTKIGSLKFEQSKEGYYKQTFYYATYIPEKNKILISYSNCFGLKAIKSMSDSDNPPYLGFPSDTKNPQGWPPLPEENFCSPISKDTDCEFKNGFTVGATDDRGYFEIIDVKESKRIKENEQPWESITLEKGDLYYEPQKKATYKILDVSPNSNKVKLELQSPYTKETKEYIENINVFKKEIYDNKLSKK